VALACHRLPVPVKLKRLQKALLFCSENRYIATMDQNDIDRTLVRTARALLDWSQVDLATRADIALATLKRFEKGRTPIPVIRAAIFRVLEDAGVVFQASGKDIGVSINIRKLPK
jgi:DNA-binding XRE family transcriptional regulator